MPLGTPGVRAGLRTAPGRLPETEVLSAVLDGRDAASSAGLFMSPHHHHGRGPEEDDETGSPEDGITQKTDPCRLLDQGARN
ncbi:hypothetical protein NDU88_001229 [Pleurodeles waltl]|uniref:Uncharacterized protein n=1 Tax=Pleurodeles waltl TaxID=8319 RepID=A0AAV7V9S8_PLEWA|nr:hypothetical protein NDU88_001229 [Pleurodeles waltl]